MPSPSQVRKYVEPALCSMTHHPVLGRPARRGFTLLELVLSLGLIAFVAAFAISSFFSQSDMTLHNALQLLADDVHEMQARATSLQIPVDIVFDPSGDGYHAEDRGTPDPHRARLFPLVSRRYSSDAVFEGVRIRRLELKGSDRISFDEGGRSPTTGSIVVGYQTEARVLELRSDRGFTYLPDSPRTRGWLDRLR
jgi:prepilin-type N-terminal cleavage/methylation domain-containing protein